MATTVPGLDSTGDILDTDMLMITHSTGLTEKLSGLEFNKRNRIIIANNLTITGAPLHAGNVVRIYFTADIMGVNTSSAMVINYNGTNYNVKAPSNGSVKNFTATDMGSSTYKFLQAYTTLELLFDGTQFVIIGNPVVISSADYTIYTDGTLLDRSNTLLKKSYSISPASSVQFNIDLQGTEFIIYITNRYSNAGNSIYIVAQDNNIHQLALNSNTVLSSYNGNTKTVTLSNTYTSTIFIDINVIAIK